MKLDSAVLYSTDIDKALSFYQDVIGLELDYRNGNNFVSFNFSNGASLGIKKAVEKREVPGTQAFIIGVENANSEYEAMKKKGAKFYKELTEESWGVEFAILDPDNNKVEFIQRK